MSKGLAVIAGAALLLFVGAVRANDAAIENTAAEDGTDVDFGDEAAGTIDQFNPWAIMNNASAYADLNDRNVRAFLAALYYSEGTDRADDPYAVCYGYRHTITDFSDHPAIAEGWRGEPLDNLGPRYRGLVSTAAGAGQIIKPTWVMAKKALGLTDFTPESQERAYVWLIDKAGALGDVKAGRFQTAIAKCAGTWASFPGSTANQPQRKLAALQQAYTSAGGYIA